MERVFEARTVAIDQRSEADGSVQQPSPQRVVFSHPTVLVPLPSHGVA